MKNETLHDWLALIATGLVAMLFMRSAYAYNAICRVIERVVAEGGDPTPLGFWVIQGKYIVPAVLLSVTAALVIHYYLSENKILVTLTAFVTYLLLSLTMSYLITKPLIAFLTELKSHKHSHANKPVAEPANESVPK
jgi:hypothetical protein